MRPALSPLVPLALAAAAACHRAADRAPPAAATAAPHAAPAPAAPAAADPADLGDGLRLGAPARYRNLTLIPVVATGEVDGTDYLVLDEGMRRGAVRIAEKPDADVNALTLTNRSERPLFLLGGEVVIGGKQDRIIGKNTVVPARTTLAVPVFCVEHGRWTGRHADFASAGALAHARLREKAAFEAQGDVWDEVATKNAARGLAAGNPTGTYRGAAAQEATTLGAWDAAFDRALAAAPAADRARTVGYAVALGGDVVAVDVFGGPRLLAALDRKLRRSYYAEAQDAPAAEGATPTAAAVRAFLHHADAAPDQAVYATDAADTFNQLGDDVAATKVMTKTAAGGGKPRAIYTSVTKHARKAAVAAPPRAWSQGIELEDLGPLVGDPFEDTQLEPPVAPPRVAPPPPPVGPPPPARPHVTPQLAP